MSDQVYAWLLTEPRMAQVEKCLSESGIPFTTMLTGPFMALFANLIDLDSCLHVMDRLILEGKNAIIDIVKHCLLMMRKKLVDLHKQDKLHQFLIKQIYLEALVQEEFFPALL